MSQKGKTRKLIKLSLLLVLLLVITTNFNKANTNIGTVENQDKQKIFGQLSSDINPPVITVTNPLNGDVVTEPELTVTFTVSNSISIKEVFVNGTSLPVSLDGQYSHNLVLKPGENSISIIAIDSNNNKSTEELIVGFLSFGDLGDLEGVIEESLEALEGILELTQELIEELGSKEIISLTEEFTDLNETLIDLFSSLTKGLDEIIDIANTVSIEIANAPPLPEGFPAIFELPEIEGIDFFGELEEVFEIPKGFSFATDISFDDFTEPITLSKEDLSKQNTAVLVDASGKTFVVGFAFLRKVEGEFTGFRKALKKNYRFQTTSGEPLELTTTVTIPADATEGNAKVSILNKNESLATIPLKVTPPREVKVGKKLIGKPQIVEPIIAIVKKSGKQLSLKIKGKNFVQRIATIDGKLEKLIGKANFFTNVTFVPPEGIKIKSIKIKKNSVNVIAEIKGDIKPGIKLFNVITPKGADIGAIVFPDILVDGKLETTATPEELILENVED